MIAVLIGWALLRRRRSPPRPAIAAAPVPAAPPPPPSAPRARLAIQLSPTRAGLTLISLVFEGEVLVRNEGDAPARHVRVEATPIPARTGIDAELGAMFARPIGRPAVPAFTLAPSEERRVRVVAALPLEGAEPLVAAGRRMLIPVIAVNARYHAGEAGDGQAAAAWIVGVTREGTGKLAPFWLDTPGMTDRLAARPHALAVNG